MLTILLTGSNGFLGSALSNRLSTFKNVDLIRVTRRSEPNLSSSIKCDLTNATETKSLFQKVDPDFLIHTASFVPKTSQEYEDELTMQNIIMAENLTTYSKAKFVNISSMSVYGVSDNILYSEFQKVRPETAYGKSKFAIEKLLQNKKNSSISFRIPGLVGSQRKSGLVYNTIKSLIEMKPLKLPQEPIQWATMNISDAADSIIKALMAWDFNANSHQTINVGYQGVFSINIFLDIIEELFNVKIPYDIKHPEFEFNLELLKSLGSLPKQNLKEMLVNLKNEYGL